MKHALAPAAWFLAVLAPACGGGGYDDSRRPNVFLVVADTLRGDYVEGAAVATPALATLAADGVRFTHAFSHAPMTLPSHTALFSSRPPFETGVLNNYQDVPSSLPLLAEHMQRFGYATHAVISLGTLNPRKGEGTGLDRGFDVYDLDYWHMDTAESAVERMARRLDQVDTGRPFFFFAHFTDPHRPYNAHGGDDLQADVKIDGEPFLTVNLSDMTQWEGEVELEAGEHELEFTAERDFRIGALEFGRDDPRLKWEATEGGLYKTLQRVVVTATVKESGTFLLRFWTSEVVKRKATAARYGGEVEYLDRHLGAFFDELRTRGLYDDSVILFTSDHGEALYEHDAFAHVQNLYDEMINVPLIVKLPAGHPALGRLEEIRDAVVPHMDLVPTILDLTGLPALEGARGTSLLTGRSNTVFAETHKPEAKHNYLGIRDDRYKLIYDPDAQSFEMYDLQADPDELVDVFAEHGDERADWQAQLELASTLAKKGVPSMGDASAETLEALQALGYAGTEE
jgi:arylsulfatase A-like enzyme